MQDFNFFPNKIRKKKTDIYSVLSVLSYNYISVENICF